MEFKKCTLKRHVSSKASLGLGPSYAVFGRYYAVFNASFPASDTVFTFNFWSCFSGLDIGRLGSVPITKSLLFRLVLNRNNLLGDRFSVRVNY